ncbi:MAG: hypothetical protein ABSE51_20290 [Terracidiphilus sp.]|jgi:hypothetical protein
MKYRLSGALFLAVFLTIGSAWAQTKMRLLSSDEVAASAAKLSSSLIPGIVDSPHAIEDQSFSVEGSGFQSFLLLPVKYEWSNQANSANPADRCGVFVEYSAGASQFLPIDEGLWTCFSFDAVGFVAATNPAPPRLLILYSVLLATHDEQYASIMDWNASSKKYVWNQKLSNRLTLSGKATSIAEIKRLLKGYEGTKSK